MALIVATTRSVEKRPGHSFTECDTLIFEDEEQGKKFVKDNKQFVYNVQKARVIKNGETRT
ncbi:hypothetical protein [Escherichia phage AV124]|nr:hypothetical protein [Escherichia phage AV124]